MSDDTFGSLVSSMSPLERKAMLERLKGVTAHSRAPLWDIVTENDAESVEASYQKQGFWTRFLCGFTAFLSQTKPVEIYKERLFKSLQARITAKSVNFADFRHMVYLEGLRRELDSLKQAARFFHPAFEASMDRDKAGFVVYIASLFIEELQPRIMRECDPWFVGETNSLWDDQTVLKQCKSQLDDLLATVLDHQRKQIYALVRGLLCLRKLAGFPFDRLLTSFQPGVSGRRDCPFSIGTPLLTDLGDILATLSLPPEMEILEGLFLYPWMKSAASAHEAQGAVPGSVAPAKEAETQVAQSLVKAEESLEGIRAFLSAVPLADLLKVANRNLSWQPRSSTGGEDWFGICRTYWEEWINSRYSTYIRDRQRMRVMRDVDALLGGKPRAETQWIKAEGKGVVFPMKYEGIFSFLLTYFSTVFAEELNRVLKIILIDGHFYRQDNRIEFTDAYNEILKIPESIKTLDKRLSPEGDFGTSLLQIHGEQGSIAARNHLLLTLQQNIMLEADGIVTRASQALKTTQSILKGILKPEPSGRYDSLQNLPNLDGKINLGFRPAIERSKDALERVRSLLLALAEIESIRLQE